MRGENSCWREVVTTVPLFCLVLRTPLRSASTVSHSLHKNRLNFFEPRIADFKPKPLLRYVLCRCTYLEPGMPMYICLCNLSLCIFDSNWSWMLRQEKLLAQIGSGACRLVNPISCLFVYTSWPSQYARLADFRFLGQFKQTTFIPLPYLWTWSGYFLYMPSESNNYWWFVFVSLLLATYD